MIGPLVREEFRATADVQSVAATRRALGLPSGRLALVMSWSWGVGNLAATAADLLRTGEVVIRTAPILAAATTLLLPESKLQPISG